jgi:GTP cyclohydrolase II
MALCRQVETKIPTPHGSFHMIAYARKSEEKMPHLALVHDGFNAQEEAYVRIHSECLTGDLFGSFRCDCGEQLNAALDLLNQYHGVLIYLRQEGRGIGIINKLKAYNLQDEGMNTADANTHLGFEADARIYEDALSILKDLNISRLHILTNNPDKVRALEEGGLKVLSRVPVLIPPRPENIQYFETKKKVFGHSLDW